VSGYSQGGFVSMATQKEIQNNYSSEFTVTAGGHMSGPYNMLGFTDLVMSNSSYTNVGATLFAPLLFTAYKKAYGDVYSSTSDIYQTSYASTTEGLLPTSKTSATITSSHLLPLTSGVMYTTELYTNGSRTDYLLKDSFVSGYQSDATSNPASSTVSPSNAMRKRLKENTLYYDWAPNKPMALCGGGSTSGLNADLTNVATPTVNATLNSVSYTSTTADPTVYFYTNAVAAKAALGSSVEYLYNMEDLSGLSTALSTAGATLYYSWQVYKGSIYAASGYSTQLSAYHGGLQPFCSAAIKAYFDSKL